MNNGFVSKPGEPPAAGRGAPVAGQAAGRGAPAAGQGAGRGAPVNRFAAFEEVLTKESIPEVDANFRTIADREHRAMAGLSLGGMQTFQIGTAHTELFSYLAMFSGTPQAQAQAQVDAVAAQGKAFAAKVHVLWFGVGTEEANFYTRTKEVRAQLEKAGIPSGYFESKGTAHEFQTWRRCLREFAPLLFRAAAAPAAKAPAKKK
jgi:enterochelin esterase-like enzyme